MAEKYLGLRFDPDAMIRLLGVQLYDTPLAMLRENVQNAYDAIKERIHKDSDFHDGCIKIEVVGDHVTVADNGIGMDEQGLQDNYWTAGHSGKNNPESRKAGVVGHFGIGALANFGVCSRLEVNTLRYDTTTRIHCAAERDKLNGNQFPVSFQEDTSGSCGTTVTAILMPGVSITQSQAEAYISRYVEYISIPVTINGKAIEKKSLSVNTARANSVTEEGEASHGVVSFHYKMNFQNFQPPKPEILITNIKYNNMPVNGTLFLSRDGNEIFGLNSGFGISRLALMSNFNFGGVADFTFLEPTAGREAVSRQSTVYLQQIFTAVEVQWVKVISKYAVADGYRDFLSYLSNHFDVAMAANVTVAFGSNNLPLSEVTPSEYAYYAGNNSETKLSLSSSSAKVLFPSSDALRRQIQLRYFRAIGLHERRDEINVIPISENDLDGTEMLLTEDIKRVIEDDYVIHDVEVVLAEITMGINIRVEANSKGSFTINITRNNAELKHLIDSRENYSLYRSLVKDFVRVVLYNHFVDYIPKGQKERAAYINETLERRREEMHFEYSDVSELREALRQFDKGEISSDEFFKRAQKARREKHEEVLHGGEVGHIENVVKTTENPTETAKTTAQHEAQFLYIPQPPILELDEKTDKKILTASIELATLHGHTLFLSVSPNFNREYRSFMLLAHSTKVIWSTHRIIYIFTDQNNKTSLYYEMALMEQLGEQNTGGEALVSTTIITKNMMYVPVPKRLHEYFTLKQGKTLKFYVHFEKV